MSRFVPYTPRQRALVTLIALSAAPLAHAQEVEKNWETISAWGQPLTTERQAQQAIESNFSSFETAGPLTWHVASSRVGKDKVSYDYRIKPAKLVITDWEYKFKDQPYATEQAVIAAIKADKVSAPDCPATEVVPGPWSGIPGGGEGSGADGSNTGESATYGSPYYMKNPNTGSCDVVPATASLTRTRTVQCPNTALLRHGSDAGASRRNVVELLKYSAYSAMPGWQPL